jgi:hypothetical protein
VIHQLVTNYQINRLHSKPSIVLDFYANFDGSFPFEFGQKREILIKRSDHLTFHEIQFSIFFGQQLIILAQQKIFQKKNSQKF